jgi:iron complex outermembrane receptor protein
MKKFINLSLGLSLVPFFALSSVNAQEPLNSAEGSPEIKEIVVTATRSSYDLEKVPVSVRVIDRQAIANSAALSVAGLLRNEGSLQITDSIGNGHDVRLSLRGMSGDANALVLIDGRKLNNTDMANVDLTAVSIQEIERVEIFEGGAGVLFGGQAVGGVINIITRRGEQNLGHISLGLGSYGNRDTSLFYAGTKDEIDYQVSFNKTQANGYRDGTDVDDKNSSVKLGYRYSQGELFFDARKVDNQYYLPGGLRAADLGSNRKQTGPAFMDYTTDSNIYQLGIDHRFNEKITAVVSASERDEAFFNLSDSPSMGQATNNQYRNSQIFDPRLLINLDGVDIVAGIDVEGFDYTIDLVSTLGPMKTEHKHDRQSKYLQAIISPNQDTSVSLGLRHAKADVKVNGTNNNEPFESKYENSLTVSQMGVSHKLSNELRFFINRDENFRFALADENVSYDGMIADLKPQEGVSWELGSVWNSKDLSFRWLLFQQNLENEIRYNDSTWSNENSDDTQRQGSTIDIGWAVNDRLNIDATATVMDAKVVAGALKNKTITGVSDQTAKVSAQFSPVNNLNLYIEAVYTGGMYIDRDNEEPKLGGYTLTNMGASYQWDDFKVRARLNNIMGKKYSEYVVYSGSAPSYYPSAEESFNLSLEYSF